MKLSFIMFSQIWPFESTNIRFETDNLIAVTIPQPSWFVNLVQHETVSCTKNNFLLKNMILYISTIFTCSMPLTAPLKAYICWWGSPTMNFGAACLRQMSSMGRFMSWASSIRRTSWAQILCKSGFLNYWENVFNQNKLLNSIIVFSRNY